MSLVSINTIYYLLSYNNKQVTLLYYTPYTLFKLANNIISPLEEKCVPLYATRLTSYTQLPWYLTDIFFINISSIIDTLYRSIPCFPNPIIYIPLHCIIAHLTTTSISQDILYIILYIILHNQLVKSHTNPPPISYNPHYTINFILIISYICEYYLELLKLFSLITLILTQYYHYVLYVCNISILLYHI